ncbi:hypothetical protein LP414_19610 [Polaromonas sp. P1(28)-13]|nr:hypothetical protein LP414_19610 [Polaromonas sp. P1(28)-13]
MARQMGICEKQFWLKLGKTIFRLRHAMDGRKKIFQEKKYKVLREYVRKSIEYFEASEKN